MPSLRDYRDRIKSVKSTKKITSAMKMVAASKLRRAQEQAQASQAYAQAMAGMLSRVAANIQVGPGSSKLLTGTGSEQKQLLVVVTADRGLCGGFNSNLYRAARLKAFALLKEGKEVSIVCIGRKGAELMKRELKTHVWKGYTGFTGKANVEYADAHTVTSYILEKFETNAFDVCTLIYNEFQSVLVQKPVAQQVIPFRLPEVQAEEETAATASSPYDFEPDEEQILNDLLPKNIGVQIFRALLETSAGEQAARMTAMDNATRNAGEMISDLTLAYNRARQAYITKELIEIISGAEAL